MRTSVWLTIAGLLFLLGVNLAESQTPCDSVRDSLSVTVGQLATRLQELTLENAALKEQLKPKEKAK